MNIEDSMRKSFDPQAFEFNEAHWEGAKVLLDKEFARQALIKDFIYAGFVILFIGFVFFRFVTANPTEVPNNIYTEHSIPIITFDEHDQSKEVSSERVEEKTQHSNPNIFPSEDQNKSAPKVNQSEPEHSIQTSSKSNSVDPIKPSSDQSTTLLHVNNEADFEPEVLVGVISETNYHESEMLENDPQLEERPGFNTISVFALLGPKLLSELSVASIQEKAFFFPELPEFSNGKSVVQAQKAVSQTFITAEVMMYPTSLSSDFNYIGVSVGAAKQFPLGKNYFLEAGVKGSVRMGEFTPSQQSTQLSFDFAPRENAYVLTPSAVVSLQMPIMFGFEMGKSQISGGIIPAYLLGVYGASQFQSQLHPWETEFSPIVEPSNTIKKGWLNSSGFNQFAMSYGLRYHYNLRRGFQAGISVQYRPGDWVGEDYGKYYDFRQMDYVFTSADQRNLIRRNWIVGLEMRYRL